MANIGSIEVDLNPTFTVHPLSFLMGALTGVMIMGCLWLAVELYRELHMRISAIEGFIRALQIMMAGGSGA